MIGDIFYGLPSYAEYCEMLEPILNGKWFGRIFNGCCGGLFGKNNFGPKKIAGIGDKWLVVEQIYENDKPIMVTFKNIEERNTIIKHYLKDEELK